MKLFVKKLLLFASICVGLVIAGLFMPANPKVFKSLLFAQIDKDSLLVHAPSRRIILIGGSNLSFGINSAMLKDSFNLNPINTGINANLGLDYMLNHNLKFIKKGDVVIVAPEYAQYYGDYFYGKDELLRMVFDVSRADICNLSVRQWSNLFPFMVSYISSKFNLMDRLYPNTQEASVYLRSSFNKYGDVTAHWNRKSEKITSSSPEIKPFNEHVIPALQKFEQDVKHRGATFLLTYPGFRKTSFEQGILEINHIQEELLKTKFTLLGNPERYEFADSLFYNTPYHLTKKGTDKRTLLLIKDLRPHVYTQKLK